LTYASAQKKFAASEEGLPWLARALQKSLSSAEKHQGGKVRLHAAGVITLAVVLSWPACKKADAPVPSISSISTGPRRETVDAATKDALKIGPTVTYCHGRPRCSVADRLPAGNPEAGHVVVVRLAAPADAADDEARCDRREYWLSRPEGDLLLAADCESQWGAENAGPATVTVSGTLATFHYVEFLADDACEIVDAALRLPQGRIEAHARRHLGKVVGNACRPSRRGAPIPAPGSGILDHPILVLHRP
jgi:hypothetical protein